MPHRILLASALVFLGISNLVWLTRDTRPPFWDMAYHQTSAVRIYDAVSQDGIRAFSSIPHLTGFYPPLYPMAVAAAYAVLGRSPDAAQLVNFAAIFVLALATLGIGRRLMSPLAATVAAILVSFYPLMLWLSRETLIDYLLAAITATAIYTLLRTESFANMPWTVAFGVVCGLGMLTKWTFVFFVALPFLWIARSRPGRAAFATLAGVIVASYWYWPRAQVLVDFFALNSAGAAAEGDPARLSVQSVVFYIRAMEGYQLFLPLFVLFLVGLALATKVTAPDWKVVLLWIVSGWAGLLIFQNKDPRYAAPLLPAVALISSLVVQRYPRVLAALIPFLAFQHYLVSFGVKGLPEEVVLVQGPDGPLRWNWNLYTQSYMKLWGRPERQDWKIEYVLQKITRSGRPAPGQRLRLGMIPDIPRFDSIAFDYHIELLRFPVVVNRLWQPDERLINDNDFILMSETDQGFAPNFTQAIPFVNRYVMSHPERFHPEEWFPLPNGAIIRLYAVVPAAGEMD